MSKQNIKDVAYYNAEKTAIILTTEESGEVCVFKESQPDYFAEIEKAHKPKPFARTIKQAAYCNAEKTAIILNTEESGAVCVFKENQPDYFAEIEKAHKPKPFVLQVSWPEIRAKRDALLAECDWTQLQDSKADVKAWATYRQALRDVPKQPDPNNIQWPEKP